MFKRPGRNRRSLDFGFEKKGPEQDTTALE